MLFCRCEHASYRLHSSQMERHWYDTQAAKCCAAARAALPPGAAEVAHLSAAAARAVLRPLLRLRQACDHAQVGGAGIAAATGEVLTQEAISARLVERATTAAEEAQRAVALDLNALGGCVS